MEHLLSSREGEIDREMNDDDDDDNNNDNVDNHTMALQSTFPRLHVGHPSSDSRLETLA